MTLSTPRTVAEVLQTAATPLAMAEIVTRIRPMGAARTAKPEAAVRSALFENPRIGTLGGRRATPGGPTICRAAVFTSR